MKLQAGMMMTLALAGVGALALAGASEGGKLSLAGTPTARALSSSELGSLYGGCFDEYCEVKEFTCNTSYGSPCILPLSSGDYCARCEHDTQIEECDGDNLCIPWVSCSDCIVDTAHDCGMETIGTCNAGGGCNISNTGDIDCNTAFQCHTA